MCRKCVQRADFAFLTVFLYFFKNLYSFLLFDLPNFKRLTNHTASTSLSLCSLQQRNKNKYQEADYRIDFSNLWATGSEWAKVKIDSYLLACGIYAPRVHIIISAMQWCPSSVWVNAPVRHTESPLKCKRRQGFVKISFCVMINEAHARILAHGISIDRSIWKSLGLGNGGFSC